MSRHVGSDSGTQTWTLLARIAIAAGRFGKAALSHQPASDRDDRLGGALEGRRGSVDRDGESGCAHEGQEIGPGLAILHDRNIGSSRAATPV